MFSGKDNNINAKFLPLDNIVQLLNFSRVFLLFHKLIIFQSPLIIDGEKKEESDEEADDAVHDEVRLHEAGWKERYYKLEKSFI